MQSLTGRLDTGKTLTMASPTRGRSQSSSPPLAPGMYDPLHPVELDDYPTRPQNTQNRSISPTSRSWLTGSEGKSSQPTQYRSITNMSAEIDADDRARKSMGTPSLYSLGRFRTDADTAALVEARRTQVAKFHIHWVTPFLMVLLFLLGIVGAGAHHAFYTSLNGRPATNQLWMVRYGTALAFFVKATLVGSVILSYRQRIWQTFRKRAMTMSAIDGLFAATEDPSMFVKWEMIRNAKLAVVMAMGAW